MMTPDLVGLYQELWAVRAFEERGEQLVRDNEIAGNLHLSIGQEAVAVGVCGALRPDDYVTTTHRGHGHCLAKGGDPDRMFAELFGNADGYCKGRAGSMHIADPASGILGATAIVGGSYGMAVGAAFSAQVLGNGRVAAAFFGEGAAGEGSFHEALNIAALWKLPLLFCCENNQYAELTPVSEHLSGAVHELGSAHGVPSALVDGNDVLAVRVATEEAIARAREGDGPTVLEYLTYRWSGHYVGDPESYRSREEVDEWKRRDPIDVLAARLGDLLSEDERSAIAEAAHATMAAASARAAAGARATPDLILENVYAANASGPDA
jgi:TPP-dependent pyruvate/acetoin dehydrogenase alpha subunit